MLLLAAAGCNSQSNSEEVSTINTAIQQPEAGNNDGNHNLSGSPSLSDNRTRPFRPSDNGTMPIPPGGEFRQGPAMPDIDWAAAAATLGVTEDALRGAVGDLSAGMPDFAAIAAKLGITEQQLREALGFNGGNMPPGGERPQGQPPTGGGEPPQDGESQGGPGMEY